MFDLGNNMPLIYIGKRLIVNDLAVAQVIHCMMTSSNGNIFRLITEFPAQRPATRSFDVFFDLRLNKRLSKQP